MSSCLVASKQRKLNNNKISTIFSNSEDDKQCINIINILNSCINNENNNNNYPQITHHILKEISEYATGLIIKCHGEFNDVMMFNNNNNNNNNNNTKQELLGCQGFIHYLRGNNFNVNYQYKNKWFLFNYQCDDDNCRQEVNIFECSAEGCDDIEQVDDGQDIYPYHACTLVSCDALIFVNSCQSFFCIKHFKDNGIFCNKCHHYYCNLCNKSEGDFCQECNKFYCQKCINEFQEHDIDKFALKMVCEVCKWNISTKTGMLNIIKKI